MRPLCLDWPQKIQPETWWLRVIDRFSAACRVFAGMFNFEKSCSEAEHFCPDSPKRGCSKLLLLVPSSIEDLYAEL